MLDETCLRIRKGKVKEQSGRDPQEIPKRQEKRQRNDGPFTVVSVVFTST